MMVLAGQRMRSKYWVVRATPQVSRQSTEPPWIKPRKKTEAKPPASQVTEIPNHPSPSGTEGHCRTGAFLESIYFSEWLPCAA